MGGRTKGCKGITLEVPDDVKFTGLSVRKLLYHLIKLFPLMKLTKEAQQYAEAHNVPTLFNDLEDILKLWDKRVK